MAEASWTTTIGACYDRGDTLLVLPSEVSAAGWRRVLAADPARCAVRSDRIVSWDVFKERAVPVKRDRQPASRVIRRAFAAAFLASPEASPMRVMLQPGFGVPAGLDRAVARLLPQIRLLLAQGRSLRAGLRSDLQLLSEAWAAFMDHHGLFEPEWERERRLDLSSVPWRPVIVGPELLEDFPEYEALLAESVELITLADTTGTVPAGRWDSLHDEIAAALDAVEAALARGVPMTRIAITLADPGPARPWLDREADRRGIPLHHAAGEPLSSSPGGRIPAAMRATLDEDFSVQSLERMLMDRSVPWRRESLNRRLIRFGYLTHCYHRKRWDQAFADLLAIFDQRDAGETEDAAVESVLKDLRLDVTEAEVLRDYWREIHRRLSMIAAARSVDRLHAAVRGFLQWMIHGPGHAGWAASEPVYETALTELDALLAVEQRGIPVPSPWSFFLTSLDERSYVPRSEGTAIPVYNYRVAAGLALELHCVIGLSQSATRVRSEPPVGLRQSELQGIGWLQRDRSRAFLRVYGHPSAAGLLSCSDSGPAGAQVPAAELTVPDTSARSACLSSWEPEERWWRDPDQPFPARVYTPQRRAAELALASVLTPVAVDGRRQALPEGALHALEDESSLTATGIDAFTDCPFSFLMRERLHLRSSRAGFDPDRARVVGSIAHRVLDRVLSWNADTEGRSARIRELVEEEFARPDARLLLPEAGRPQRAAYLARVVDLMLERGMISLERGGVSEMSASGRIGGVTVHGRMDRVAGMLDWHGEHGRTDGQPVELIDFKLHLRQYHAKGSVLGGSDGDPAESTTLQLPLYALLLREATGATVASARYVDLSSLEERELTRSRGGTDPRFETLLEQLPDYVRHVDEQVRGGVFVCRDDHGCDRCRIRSLCRSCFVTRRFGDA